MSQEEFQDNPKTRGNGDVVVRITGEELFKRLQRVEQALATTGGQSHEERLRAMETTLAAIKADTSTLPQLSRDVTDHETRLRGVEHTQFALPASLISSIVSLAIAVILIFIK